MCKYRSKRINKYSISFISQARPWPHFLSSRPLETNRSKQQYCPKDDSFTFSQITSLRENLISRVCMYAHIRRECVLLNSTTHLASKVMWAPHWTGPIFPLKLATLVSGNRRCLLSDVTHSPSTLHTKLLYTTFCRLFKLRCTCLSFTARCVSPFSPTGPANCSSTLIRWFLEWVHSWFGSCCCNGWRKLQEIRDLVVLGHGAAKDEDVAVEENL